MTWVEEATSVLESATYAELLAPEEMPVVVAKGPGILRVTLKHAAGLLAKDSNGKSDPYVKVLSGGGEKKTKVKKRTLDPEWNEAIDFEGRYEAFVGTGLTLKLYDWDRIGSDDALGELSVDLRVLEAQSHVDLVEQLPTRGFVHFSVTWLPKGDVSYTLELGTLHVHLKRASGIKAGDWNGSSDPYVKVLSGEREARGKVVKSSLDPVWDEVVELQGNLQEFVARGLLLQLYDWDRFDSDDALGDVQVALDTDRLRTGETLEMAEAVPTRGTLYFSVTWAPNP